MENEESDREALERLARGLRQRLAWEAEGGVVGVGRAPARPAKVVSAAATATATAEVPAIAVARPRGTSTSFGDPCGSSGLRVIRDDLGDCQRCKLAGGRTNLVFGVGNPDAALVFVGEGPGADEDRTGEPFVGKAGQLLNKMIAAMGFAREDVYICNVVKCRPPGNRQPEPDEVAACEPFLRRQLASLQPRVMVTLGRSAVQALLRTEAAISGLRGKMQRYEIAPGEAIPLMPTYHPAYLLRTPSAKRDVWEDLQKVMAELDRLGVARRPVSATAAANQGGSNEGGEPERAG